MLSNLVANAVKFTEGGEVRVEVELLAQQGEGQRLRFAVVDDGIGIPEAVQARIFERFTQASEEVTRRYGGSGLGLAISKRLVEAMGGCIGLRSREGQGSTFWFEVELQPAAGPARVAEPVQRSEQSLRVLLVEDVPLNREVAQGLLERDGHAVRLAEDAEPALAACRESAFDLILLDMHLPGLGGLELCREIRAQADGRNRETPILAFTASVQPALVRSYFEAGMQGVLAKPLRLDDLRRALANLSAPPPAPASDGAIDEQVLATHRELLGEHRVKELLGILRDLLAQQLPLLREALRAGDTSEAAGLAHRLAGSCHSMGLRGLGDCLQALEEAALAGEPLHGWAEKLDSQLSAATPHLPPNGG